MTAKPPLELIVDPGVPPRALRVWCWIDHLYRMRGAPVEAGAVSIGRALGISASSVRAQALPLLETGWVHRDFPMFFPRPSWTPRRSLDGVGSPRLVVEHGVGRMNIDPAIPDRHDGPGEPGEPPGPFAEVPARLLVDTRVKASALRVWCWLDQACRAAGCPVRTSGRRIHEALRATIATATDDDSGVHGHLRQLERLGYVCRWPVSPRTYEPWLYLTVDDPRT